MFKNEEKKSTAFSRRHPSNDFPKAVGTCSSVIYFCLAVVGIGLCSFGVPVANVASSFLQISCAKQDDGYFLCFTTLGLDGLELL